MKHLMTFEKFNVGELSNFSNEDLKDIHQEFEVISDVYKLEDLANTKRTETAHKFEDLINQNKSFYYVNSARNAYIDIFYFGIDKEEFIDDMKSFIQKMNNSYGFKIINSWSYTKGFPCDMKENENGESYLEISLVFHK